MTRQCMAMVLILDGNSEIDAHGRSDLCYLICVRQLTRSRAVTNQQKSLKYEQRNLYIINFFNRDREQSQIRYFYPKRPIFLHACATCFELPSNISTMVHESLVCYNSDKIGSIYENLDRIKSIVRSYDIYL